MLQDGIEVKKTTEEDEEGGTISNRKPRKAALAKDKLYGCFVKVRVLSFLLKVQSWFGTASADTSPHRSKYLLISASLDKRELGGVVLVLRLTPTMF